jgi:hypothetical protein
VIPKALDAIDRSDIESLVLNNVAEGRTTEYKEALPGGKDSDKKEFLADVSSFANASGGDLYYGVEEHRAANGSPTGVPASAGGLALPNADVEIRRVAWMPTDKKKPNRTTVQFHGLSAMACDCRRLSGLSM